MPLVRTFEDLMFEVRKQLGRIAREMTRNLRGIERMEKEIELMEHYYHIYRKIRRSTVNLFERVVKV